MNKQHITWHAKDIHLLELLTYTIILYNIFWFHKLEKNDSLKSFSKFQLNVNLIDNHAFAYHNIDSLTLLLRVVNK